MITGNLDSLIHSIDDMVYAMFAGWGQPVERADQDQEIDTERQVGWKTAQLSDPRTAWGYGAPASGC